MRKALQSEQAKVEMQAKIKVLESEVRELDKHVNEMQEKCSALEQRDAERVAEETAKHKEEVDFLKKHNADLKKELENLLSIPSPEAEAKK